MIETVFVVIDSSVLVGLLNPTDHRHAASVNLIQALQGQNHSLFYLDCVIAESITTITRRLNEQRRKAEIPQIFSVLQKIIPHSQINWVFPEAQRLYEPILQLMQQSGGELNFNDALIALACREHGIGLIASFDSDFDLVSWLRRLATPTDVIGV